MAPDDVTVLGLVVAAGALLWVVLLLAPFVGWL